MVVSLFSWLFNLIVCFAVCFMCWVCRFDCRCFDFVVWIYFRYFVRVFVDLCALV